MEQQKTQEEFWDKEYSNNSIKWHKETAHLPKLTRAATVLELGVGNGKTLTAILRQKVKSVTAVDFSSNALEITKSSCKDKRVSFIKADVTNLPCKDNSFEVVVCYFLLNNLLEPEAIKAIQEIYRVLKPNGIVVFEDFATGDFRQTEKINLEVEKNTFQNRVGIICHFFTISELKRLFKDFSKIKLVKKASSPIAHKSHLKRKIISGIITK